MPEARTADSFRWRWISSSSGFVSTRRCFAFSTRKGITSRLREIMLSMAKSSSSVARICLRSISSQSFSASARSPWATSAALIAPTDAP